MRRPILVLIVVLLPGLAGGQSLSKEQIKQAKQHYSAGAAAEKKADWATAVKEYSAAYEITRDPKVFYPIAKAHEQAGKLDDALLYYRRYLNEATLSDAGENEVKAKIDALEAKTRPAEPPPTETPASVPGEGD